MQARLSTGINPPLPQFSWKKADNTWIVTASIAPSGIEAVWGRLGWRWLLSCGFILGRVSARGLHGRYSRGQKYLHTLFCYK
jgi:hypothetical protein